MVKQICISTALICFLLFALTLTPMLSPQESGIKQVQLPAAEEQLLGELSPNTDVPGPEMKRSILKSLLNSPDTEEDYVFNSTGLRFACRAKRGDKWTLIVDGKERAAFDGIKSMLISPDGEKVVYSAKQSGKWVKMLDDKEIGQPFDDLGGGYWSFGDSGLQHYAYAAKRGAKWLVVNDSKEGAEFEDVRAPRLIRGRLVYAAKVKKSSGPDKWTMVVDGQKGGEYDAVGIAVLSADGQRIAYNATHKKATNLGFDTHMLVVIDGKEGSVYEEVGMPVFSSDGRHVAYRARREKKRMLIVLDGKEEKEFEEVGLPVFSPDSQHLAYKAKCGSKREVLVLDGEMGPEFEDVGTDNALMGFDGTSLSAIALDAGDMTNPVFSPDGKHLAYYGKRGKKWRMVIDRQEGPEFQAKLFSGPIFSDDSQHSASVVLRRLGETFELRDGKMVAEVAVDVKGFSQATPFIESPVISPDGRKFAYIVGAGGNAFTQGKTSKANRCVVLDGHAEEKYDSVGISLSFSPDSRYFVCFVRGGTKDNKSMVVTNSQNGKVYDDVFGGGFLVTKHENSSKALTLAYIAREGRRFYRVTQLLP
jgi:hypothetical protein